MQGRDLGPSLRGRAEGGDDFTVLGLERCAPFRILGLVGSEVAVDDRLKGGQRVHLGQARSNPRASSQSVTTASKASCSQRAARA